MKDLTLNQIEQKRLHVLNSVLEHQLPVAQAAKIPGVSERHAWHLLASHWREGAAALAHRNRGRKPRNAVADDEANAVVQLVSTTCAGANHTHITELLRNREGVDLSRSTVRRILTRVVISSPRHRRPPKHRVEGNGCPRLGCWCRLTTVSTGGWSMTVPIPPAPGLGRRHQRRGQRGVQS